jgi:hypothetical protein
MGRMSVIRFSALVTHEFHGEEFSHAYVIKGKLLMVDFRGLVPG